MKNPNTGRKLKAFAKREPEEIVKKREWVLEVSNRTGYPANAIMEIASEMIEVWKELIMDKKAVMVYGLGKLYASLKPGKNMVDMGKGKLVYKSDFYVPKMTFGATLRDKLKTMEVTEEEVENMYVD